MTALLYPCLTNERVKVQEPWYAKTKLSASALIEGYFGAAVPIVTE